MTASSSRPSSRHAARVSALVAIALCALAPIAVSAAGAPSGSTPRGAVGDALRSWIDANGDAGVELEGVYLGEHDGVAAAYRAGGATRRDVGVFAASGGLDAGEAYVSVPWSLVVSAETVGAHRPKLGALLTQLRAEYGEDEKSALMLALLHERFASPDDSPWREYFAALPAPGDDDGFDATTRWSPGSLRELQGSDVLEDAIADQARVRAVHKGLTKRVFEAHTSLFPPRAATLAATEWAWSVVHSRASRVPTKGLVIVPLADMINDADEQEEQARAMFRRAGEETKKNGGGGDTSSEEARYADDFVVYDEMNDRAAVFAKRDYRAGEEVTEKYGVWSDADTLLSAGYVRGFSGFGATVELGATGGNEENDGEGEVEKGKVSCVAVSLGASSFAGADAEPEPALRRAADALKDHGFEVPWRACLSPAMRGTRDAKRVAKWASIVAENSLGDGKEKDARGDDDDDDAKRRAGGARGAAALLRVLDRRLSLYPTSLEEDEDALRMYREQVERAVARIRELEEADGDAGTTTEDDDVADTKRELTVARRAALATALRAREKRALAATRASIAGDAGGDIFIWADGVPPGGGNASADGKDEL
jgi:hypothetical protein